MKKLFLLLGFAFVFNCGLFSQTLVMNEVSNGPSGNKEYVELVVVDTTVVYSCIGVTNPPCIDIRGWIFDDNDGYHGTSGIAAGCIRFSYNPFWSCIPVGTIILIYNDADVDLTTMPPIDTSMTDGNCRLIVPASKSNWFDHNNTTPGNLSCSYPSSGWVPAAAGTWSNTFLANPGDCARIVNLTGCEVFSVCWGSDNLNNLIYIPGNASQRVYFFDNSVNNNPSNNANWTNACASVGTCGSNLQTPGAPNNPANAAWINRMNNNCTPIPPLSISLSGSSNGSCPCSGSASVATSGSIPPYTYTWSPSPGSGQGTAMAGGLCTGIYTCSVQSIVTGCIKTVTVSVSNSTVGTTASNTGAYCSGQSIQLNTPAATSYTWSGPGGFSSNSQNPTIGSSTPTMSGTYTVNVIMGSCSTSATTAVIVNSNPTVSVNNPTICAGQTTTLNASGAASYTWNTGPTTSTIAVSPTVTTNYTVIGGNGNCTNTRTTSIIVNPNPTLTINSPTICSGQSGTLTASGATSYTWNTGPNTATIITSPTVSTNYTISGTSALGCTNSSTTSITVNPNPTVSVNSSTVCSGQSGTLTAGGAASYTWNTGSNSSGIIITPTTTTNYTVNGSNSFGCVNSATTAVTVNPSPTISVNSVSICSGSNATLTAGGATSYTWNTGSNSSGIIVTPTTTTNYTVNGSNSFGCVNSATTAVTINPSPTISVNSVSICSGSSATLTAGGATSYTWSSGPTSSVNIVSPTVSSNYTVTGSNSAGCLNFAISNVSVTATPTLAPVSATICPGLTATLTVSGAGSYTWNPGSVTGNSYTTAPVSNSTYTVTGANGTCTSVAMASVSIGAGISISVNSPSICPGQSVTLTAGGATSYTWSTGANTSSITVSPTVSSTYTIGGTNGSCSGSNTSTVTVNSIPTVTANPVLNICSGETATLTAGGASTYTWNPGGMSGNSVTVSPVSNQSYSVIGTSAGGCTNTAATSINVTSTPTLTPASTTICPGGTGTLSVLGASNYTWNPGGLTGNTFTASPVSNTTYTVIGANGTCTAAAVASISIGSGITVSVNSSTICMGQSAVLNASGAGTYTWSTGSNSSSVTVNPTVTTTYTVDGSSGSCSGSNTSTVTVNSTPTITAINTVSVCAGQTVTLNASGANTYTWNPGGIGGGTVTVSPSSTQIYTVTGTNIQGCSGQAAVNVSVNPNPSITVASQTICSGQTATLTASGAVSYTWSPGANTGSVITVSPLSGSVYTVTGIANSCTAAITSTVDVIPSVVLTVNNPTICAGQSATLVAVGATNYSWIGGPNSSVYNVNPTTTTNYSVSGSIGSCSGNTVASVFVNNLPPVPQAMVTNPVCVGMPAVFSTTSSASFYSWTGPASFAGSLSTVTIPVVSLSNAGIYTLTISDANNCVNSSQLTLTVNPIPPLTASSPTTCLGNDLVLNSSGGIIFSWSGPGSFTANTANVTLANSTASMVGVYTVVTSDANGCSANRTLTITIDKCACPVFIPEGFSPNHDNAHDLFVISCIQDRPTKVEIYNRWGNLVYKSDDYKNDWQGKDNTGLKVSGEDLPAGTYYYIIKISDENKARTGFVTLWR